MFNAPEIFTNIPDIAQIYAINDAQIEELERAVEQMDSNIFLDTMDKETIERWENILMLNPMDNDTLEDRRFRVKSKILEKLPYSYRVIIRKLDALCPDGYTFIINDSKTNVETKLALKSKKMISDVERFLDEVLPLNMTFVVSIMWNQYSLLAGHTYRELAEYTQGDIREAVFSNERRI